LYDNVAVLCPREMWGLGWFRVERSRGIRCKLAFIPGLTASEIECPGKDCDGADLFRVPVRLIFPTGRELYASNKQAGLSGVTIENDGLRGARKRPLKFYVRRKLQNARILGAYRCRS